MASLLLCRVRRRDARCLHKCLQHGAWHIWSMVRHCAPFFLDITWPFRWGPPAPTARVMVRCCGEPWVGISHSSAALLLLGDPVAPVGSNGSAESRPAVSRQSVTSTLTTNYLPTDYILPTWRLATLFEHNCFFWSCRGMASLGQLSDRSAHLYHARGFWPCFVLLGKTCPARLPLRSYSRIRRKSAQTCCIQGLNTDEDCYMKHCNLKDPSTEYRLFLSRCDQISSSSFR